MVDVLKRIMTNVLTAFYQPFGAAIVFAIMFMYLGMLVKEKGLKRVVDSWIEQFRKNGAFRRMFVFVFYTAMILFRTLLNRYMWINPVSNVIGVWGFYDDKGALTTETIENLALFIPFAVLMLWSFHKKILGDDAKIFKTVWQSVKIVFVFSISIEFLQLFLRLGTFQLSDLFYNTLGGLVGGLIYWIGYKVAHRNKN